MSNFIFILELVVIALFLDMAYDTSNQKYAKSPEADYTAYYYMDIVDNQILDLKNVAEEIKIDVWSASPIQQEVLEHFPNMIVMQEIYNDRVEDNGLFKKKFFDYMEKLQNSYIAGEINEEQFKILFLTPNL
ncbi:MAG: Unknown protein [uncultured Sulfurovum sp.]|uniref:Uncharacterized protein n=1 Tax=uncultured Sulfurovum sp. TaxID=269237 RepID=A0A6S6S941_9BACT|nr:MAG: Unknown protein [uncultured Sulfurovum sp.]